MAEVTEDVNMAAGVVSRDYLPSRHANYSGYRGFPPVGDRGWWVGKGLIFKIVERI
jgi:hypothetical protein